MSETAAKPQCGGGGANTEDYDLPLHTAAIFIVFLFSIAGAGFPVVARRVKWIKMPPKVFFFCKHFGTGVLVATAFVHLVPTAFASLTDPCLPDLLTEQYPAMPGLIMMVALFMLFVIELVLKGKTGGHSHGGPTGEGITSNRRHTIRGTAPGRANPPPPPVYASRMNSSSSNEYPDEKPSAYTNATEIAGFDAESEYTRYGVPSDMPAWFQVFFAQYVRQREELKGMILNFAPQQVTQDQEPYDSISSQLDPEGQPPMDAATFRKLSLNITLLECGILFHSVFVGMTISITTDGFLILLIAIIFHQFFEGLGLGSRIAEIPYPKKAARPWVLVVAFGITCPIGQTIGLVTRNSYDPSSAFALILVGFFNAFSSGLLIYAACVDLLAEDFLTDEAFALMGKSQRIWAFSFVLLGAAGMSVVGAFA